MTTVQLSHALGSTDTPLLEETIGQNLARTVAAHPDSDALIVRHGHIGSSQIESNS